MKIITKAMFVKNTTHVHVTVQIAVQIAELFGKKEMFGPAIHCVIYRQPTTAPVKIWVKHCYYFTGVKFSWIKFDSIYLQF